MFLHMQSISSKQGLKPEGEGELESRERRVEE